jgi:hypothetical protein
MRDRWMWWHCERAPNPKYRSGKYKHLPIQKVRNSSYLFQNLLADFDWGFIYQLSISPFQINEWEGHSAFAPLRDWRFLLCLAVPPRLSSPQFFCTFSSSSLLNFSHRSRLSSDEDEKRTKDETSSQHCSRSRVPTGHHSKGVIWSLTFLNFFCWVSFCFRLSNPSPPLLLPLN